MLKKLLITTAILALPLAANAADLPRKAPMSYAPAPAPYSWTGFYLGVNAGYGIANTVIDDQDCYVSCSSQTLSPDGFTVGGTIGYNYQMGSTVLGIEGDWNWINAKEDYSSNWPSHHHAEIKSFGTIRARAGLALDKTLAYVTGGVAFVDQDVYATERPNYNHGFDISDVKAGLAVGGGAEWAFAGPWTAKLEYLYITVPTESQIRDYSCTQSYCNYNVKTNMQVLRVGVNYRF